MGELARATGLSVRTLRHWDQVGLVCPRRARAGHRCYSRADVTRLYRALALRSMGLSLEQIGCAARRDRSVAAGRGPHSHRRFFSNCL